MSVQPTQQMHGDGASPAPSSRKGATLHATPLDISMLEELVLGDEQDVVENNPERLCGCKPDGQRTWLVFVHHRLHVCGEDSTAHSVVNFRAGSLVTVQRASAAKRNRGSQVELVLRRHHVAAACARLRGRLAFLLFQFTLALNRHTKIKPKLNQT